MCKVMQERYNEEPKTRALLQEIQDTALKIGFYQDPEAQEKWETKGYGALFTALIEHPETPGSLNQKWHHRYANTVTDYKQRPVVVFDKEVQDLLQKVILNNTQGRHDAVCGEALTQARETMAKRIFAHHLKYDIIALQEGNYLDSSLFPKNYEVLLDTTSHDVNGVAFNKERFTLVNDIGVLSKRTYAVLLQDNETNKTVLFISAHLTGCNPFVDEGGDAEKGNHELLDVLELAKDLEADLRIIGMDSNVTATHSRLELLKDQGFVVDADKYLYPTCTSPWQLLDTRIDWLASDGGTIENVAILGVELNSPFSNMSDHKPIAAKISYPKSSG